MKKSCICMVIMAIYVCVLCGNAAWAADTDFSECNTIAQDTFIISGDSEAGDEISPPVESDSEELHVESEPLPSAAPVLTEAPTNEPTVAPEVTPEVSPTVSPETSPVPETTSALPEESPVPENTPEATSTPATPEDTEGWLLDAEGVRLLSGKLETLLAAEGDLQILVSTDQVIEIAEFPLERLREIELYPDPEIFPGSDWRIVCSRSERLRDEYSATEIEAALPGELAPLYIWVREELPSPTVDPSEVQLLVHTENVTTGQWSNIRPSFTMEGIGAGSELCEYAVIILDERIAMLSGNSYMPEEEGVYTVRLAIMNEMGDIVDRSEKYTLWLDWSAPEMTIEISMDQDRTMHIYAGDRVSGVAGLSLDGGESWHEISDVFSYTAPEKQAFAPGMIQLKDNAGNLTYNETEIVLKKIPSYGGGSGSSVSKDHASGDGDTASYSAYALEIPSGKITTLTLGGEEIDLRLTGGEDGEKPLSFTAELSSWMTAGGQEGRSRDTLVLYADAKAQGDIIWKINGAVLRKLYNSDIAYLVLARDGELLSLPTIGFNGGTRYAELKMMGASTQEFNYEIHMRLLDQPLERVRPGFNQSRRLLPGIWVEVDGERWQMLDRESTPEMYFYDVYCASEDLTAYPYGTYPGTTLDGETEE